MIGPQIVPTEWTQRVANLVHAIRPDWDENGVASSLRKVADRPLAQVVLAAVTAATTRPDQRTPAVIAQDGSHWRVGATGSTDQPPRAQRCVHDVVGHCDACHGDLPSKERIRELRAMWRATTTSSTEADIDDLDDIF